MVITRGEEMLPNESMKIFLDPSAQDNPEIFYLFLHYFFLLARKGIVSLDPETR